MNTLPIEFDLQPDPRILPMLGEINLAPWRCLAELVDNSVDGFLKEIRAGVALSTPQVDVALPMKDTPNAQVSIADNGPGMPPELLEKAVRAGWSGGSPIDTLGMFGMGFNIATARLGTVTTVWTSRAGDAEEHGLKIDFDELRRQKHFRTPRLTRPKVDPERSGTSITIERLKPEQRAWLAKPSSRTAIKSELARAYAAMLRPSGVPLSFQLLLNGKRVPALRHCVWSKERTVETSRFGTVSAFQAIDRSLPHRPFCVACWQWLAPFETVCSSCDKADDVVARKRHVHGWIGLQRYLSATDHGIDFIRNGRKIEIGSKDLFYWQKPDSGQLELEYPIDDPRHRGRFVGEIHLDHCRVTYTKDRFDRNDPAWDEMVGIVRGSGPLQPQKAAELGLGGNDSPLFRLFQVFRRSSPKPQVAGGWADVLVVKDNDRAEEMARKFHEGDPAFESDEPWFRLVEEEDLKNLTASPGTSPGSGLQGFGTGGKGVAGPTAGPSAGPVAPLPDETSEPPSPRTEIPSLTREYHHPGTSLRWDVKAFQVEPEDRDLRGPGSPWEWSRLADGTTRFLVNQKHPLYRSATMTPLDALLCELAHQAADFAKDKPNCRFGEVLADLRDTYGGPLKLDALALANNAESLFRSIARAWRGPIDANDAVALFQDLPASDREAIQHKLASRSVANPHQIIAEGRFLEYAPPRVIIDFILAHPELFFDGRCWEDPYVELDYGLQAATDEARGQVIERSKALLFDARWLAEQDLDDLQTAPRDRVLRAMLAVSLLSPTPTEETGDDA